MNANGEAQSAAEAADAWARSATSSCRGAYPILVAGRAGSPPTVPAEAKDRVVIDFISTHAHELAAALERHLPRPIAVSAYRPDLGAARAEFSAVVSLLATGVNSGAPTAEVLQLADDLIERGRLWLRHRFEELVQIAVFDAS